MRKTTPLFVITFMMLGCIGRPTYVDSNPAVKNEQRSSGEFHEDIEDNSRKMLKEGREIFRHDTFGSEDFWSGKLRLHQAIAGERFGGVGRGVEPKDALKLGLKVDTGVLPKILAEAVRGGSVDLGDVKTTMELLKADAVVGVKAKFDGDKLTSVGITCAICHSTVDDSIMKGIGRRLDGWPNRDLDVGAIVALAPDLSPYEQLLGVDRAAVEKVLKSWGPGKYDAELNQDGKGFRPDGKSAATVIPAAYGLAGVHLHTYTGWGSVTYWNAYVATTQMMGNGTFFDPRISAKNGFPVGEKAGFNNVRRTPDRVTPKLAALHYYQLSIPAPTPKKDSYDNAAAARGDALFNGKATCARCHVPPLYTEPGWGMHRPEEIGIDDFQAKRSPDGMYRTTPLKGLFVRAKPGFYHDGRFADYRAVVDHYDRHFRLSLTEAEKNDLIEFLKSL
jgi:mono/diheme cytochrome c family protein/cytochrome c553